MTRCADCRRERHKPPRRKTEAHIERVIAFQIHRCGACSLGHGCPEGRRLYAAAFGRPECLTHWPPGGDGSKLLIALADDDGEEVSPRHVRRGGGRPMITAHLAATRLRDARDDLAANPRSESAAAAVRHWENVTLDEEITFGAEQRNATGTAWIDVLAYGQPVTQMIKDQAGQSWRVSREYVAPNGCRIPSGPLDTEHELHAQTRIRERWLASAEAVGEPNAYEPRPQQAALLGDAEGSPLFAQGARRDA